MPEEKDRQERMALRRRLVSYVFAACVVIVFYFLLRNSRSVSSAINHVETVLQPIFIGFVMAFLTNPIMDFIEKRLAVLVAKFCKDKDTVRKAVRAISAIIATIIFGLIIIYIVKAIVPNLVHTIIYLANNIDDQIAGVLDWCNDITKGKYEASLMRAKDNKIGDLMDQGLEIFNKYVDYDQSDLVSLATSSALSVGKFIASIIIGLFVSVYVLISKETFKGQSKKLVCGILSPKYANIFLEVSRKSGEIFYGFIIGKIIDSIIIGIICYIGCLIMHMPYPVLVSVIVGVTNIIPVFGPYIGAVPTVIIIFLTEPKKGIYFLIFVLILQQIDGNVIGPKILGDSTGISSFWVVFAVVAGAGFFGVGGMIIAVPIVAIIYYIVGRLSRYLCRKRNLPEDSEDYILMDHIDLDTNTLVLHEDPILDQPKKKSIFKKKNNKK